MDIIFWSISPNVFGTVERYLGPYQLGYWLKENGFTYQVIDYANKIPPSHGDTKEIKTQNKIKDLVSITEKFITEKTKVIGISSTFFLRPRHFPELFTTSMQLLKEKYPHVKFVLGGNKAETFPPNITELFDAIVIGLAEDIMVELLKYYDNQGPEPKFRKDILHKPKYYYADDAIDKKFDITVARHDWSDNDLIMPYESLPLEVSRGCIFKCKFCQYPLLGRSKYDYARNASCLREEIIHNYERFGTTYYYLLDDTFNDTVQKVTDFYEMTKTLPFKIRYSCYLRADLLHRFPETIPMLKESGLTGAHFGIETFHPEASKAIGKAWSGTKAKEFLPWLIHEAWNDEVLTHLSFISGIPEENPESILETAKWCTENKMHSWTVKPLMIYKGGEKQFDSEYGRNAEKYGFTWPTPDNLYFWVHEQSGWTSLKALEVAKQAKQYRDPMIAKWGSWSIPSLLSMGYELQDILTKPKAFFDNQTYTYKRRTWMNLYKMKLMAYPNKVNEKLEARLLAELKDNTKSFLSELPAVIEDDDDD